MKIENLHELFVNELSDIWNGEQQLTKALPKMAEKSSDNRLAEGFTIHLQETKGQIDRIQRVVSLLGIELEKETCDAMKGLIKEGEELIKNVAKGPLLDAALITAAQKVEHYEIAAYGSLCALAKELGYDDAAAILAETLEEEKATNEKLDRLAEGHINSDARMAA